MKISIVIRAYKEEKVIGVILYSVLRLRCPSPGKEVIVVADPSDDTPSFVATYADRVAKMNQPNVLRGSC